jgi:hypothetical protein
MASKSRSCEKSTESFFSSTSTESFFYVNVFHVFTIPPETASRQGWLWPRRALRRRGVSITLSRVHPLEVRMMQELEALQTLDPARPHFEGKTSDSRSFRLNVYLDSKTESR